MIFRYREQWNRYPSPWECAGSNDKFGFIHANSEGWWVCTFEFRLSLRQWTKTSCAGSNVVLYTFYASKEGYGESTHCFELVWAFVSVQKSRAGSNGDLMLFSASSGGSGMSAHLYRLTLAFATVPKSLDIVLPQMAIKCYPPRPPPPRSEDWWVCTFAQV